MQRFAEKHVVRQVAEAVAARELPVGTSLRTTRTHSKKGMRYFLDIPSETCVVEEFIGQGARSAVREIYAITGIAASRK